MTRPARRSASPRPMARTSEMTTAEATGGAVKSLPRLKQRSREEIKDALLNEFGYANVMQIPAVVKVVVNMVVGDVAWTSPLSPRRPTTTKDERCCGRWAFRSRRTEQMAKKALVNKANKKPKFKVRGYTRCNRCGRPHAVYRKFGLCRICLREMAHAGELPGVTKSSW